MSFAQTYAGLRVLDLGTNIAGPFAAMILGDLGAEVIKIERPPIGDDTRALPPRWQGEATVFLAMNRNKRSVVLDVKDEAGREALLRLAETADVLVESFPPGYAEKMRLEYKDFAARNPKLILCSVSAFGDGPLGAQMPGYDALVQAVSGMMSFTGHPETEPVRIAPSVLDLSTGLWGALSITAALARRAASGQGEHVRVCLLDTSLTLMCHQLLGYLASGQPPQKLGSGAPSAAPYRVYQSSDGAFMLATATDPQFTRLCRELGLDDLATSPRFAAMAARLERRDELDALLAGIFARDSTQAWLNRLAAAGLSVGPVNDLPAALAMPVVQERHMLVPNEALGMPLLRLPIDNAGEGIRSAPPRLGADTKAVLHGLGYTEHEIARLCQGQ